MNFMHVFNSDQQGCSCCIRFSQHNRLVLRLRPLPPMNTYLQLKLLWQDLHSVTSETLPLPLWLGTSVKAGVEVPPDCYPVCCSGKDVTVVVNGDASVSSSQLSLLRLALPLVPTQFTIPTRCYHFLFRKGCSCSCLINSI